jgi:tetratricopeptide (TPR) repeat protein
VRAFARAGLVEPERGPGGRLSFSFQDLVLLKAARGLLSTRVGPRRIRRALVRLRERFPSGRVTDLQLAVGGEKLVAGDGERRWHPDSGQILLDFDAAGEARPDAPVTRREFARGREGAGKISADDWYGRGCELEASSPGEAREAYERALELDAEHADAHVNLGRLLHEEGLVAKAQAHYRRALEVRPDDSTAIFNLGVALEDLDRPAEAVALYERAAELDPEDADAHFNAANLREKLGDPAAALRHLKSYRRLTRPLR